MYAKNYGKKIFTISTLRKKNCLSKSMDSVIIRDSA